MSTERRAERESEVEVEGRCRNDAEADSEKQKRQKEEERNTVKNSQYFYQTVYNSQHVKTFMCLHSFNQSRGGGGYKKTNKREEGDISI